MKKQWHFWISFVLIVLVVLFSVLNTNSVEVNFGFVKFEQPLVLVIVGSIFIGAFLMFVIFFSTYWQKKKEVKELKRKLDQKTDRLEIEEPVSERLEIPECEQESTENISFKND